MKKIAYSSVVVLAAFLTTATLRGGAGAAGMPESKVDYSATSTMETEETTMKGKVYHSHGKERREMGKDSITIIRPDKKVIWMIMPAQRMYMENRIGQNSGKKDNADTSDMKFETTVVGPETVNGIAATKNKVVAKSKDGSAMGGYNWVTKDGIVVKMDLVAKSAKSKTRIKTELSDLKIGKQDPSLFEIPAGYSPMSFGGMMRDAGRDAGERDADRGRRRGRRGF